MTNKQSKSSKKEKTKVSWFYLFQKFTPQTLLHYLAGISSAFFSSKILVEIGKVIKEGNLSYIKSNWVEVVGRLILYTVIVYVHIALGIYLEELYSSHLREKLAQKYLQANFSQVQKAKFILSNYESDAIIVGTKATQIFNRCFYAIISIFLVFFHLSKDEKTKLVIPWLLFALFILTATAALLYQLSYRYRVRRNKIVQKENKYFEEIKDNIEYVKIAGAEKKETARNRRLVRSNTKSMFSFALSKSLYATIPNYAMLKYLPVALLFFVKGAIWAVVSLWLTELFSEWKKLFEMLWAYGGYDTYCSSVNQLNYAFAILEKDNSLNASKVTHLPVSKPEIIFQNVDFSYSETKKKILDDFSFTFQNGKKYAIIGPNGIGKSTLFRLIIKLYQPQAGTIKFGNAELEKIDNSALREKIVYLPNNPSFFNASLGNNIFYPDIYQKGIHEEKLEMIAKRLGIKEFINNLPKRWETLITEKGRNLSEGQKQLFSLMRAFVKDYEIYLFDEFLSNVSSERKEKVIEVVFRELQWGKIFVVISHDPEVLLHLDEIYKFTPQKLIKIKENEKK